MSDPLRKTIAGERGAVAYERWGGGPPPLLIAGLGAPAPLGGGAPPPPPRAFTRLAPDEAAQALMAFALASTFADRYPGFVDQTARLWTLEPEDRPGALSDLAQPKAR